MAKYYDSFPEVVKTKLKKTSTARGGSKLYSRRNKRNYRVLIPYTTYLNRWRNNLEECNSAFERDFIFILRADEYFNLETYQCKTDIDDEIIIGENAIVYFDKVNVINRFVEFNEADYQNDKEGWNKRFIEYLNEKFGYEPAFGNRNSWNGHFVVEARTNKKKILIGASAKSGLGNYDYDYASNETINHIYYQAAALIWLVDGMEDLCIENGFDRLSVESSRAHIMDYCRQNELLDMNRFEEIRVLRDRITCCPLCREHLQAELFLETIQQDEGREVENITITEYNLFHINPLRSGEFNHNIYNIGWGHHRCNTIQSNSTITEALDYIRRVLTLNED